MAENWSVVRVMIALDNLMHFFSILGPEEFLVNFLTKLHYVIFCTSTQTGKRKFGSNSKGYEHFFDILMRPGGHNIITEIDFFQETIIGKMTMFEHHF